MDLEVPDPSGRRTSSATPGIAAFAGREASQVIANPTQRFTQADGAAVFVQKVAGKFNVVVRGQHGVITNLKSISQRSLDRLATRYGWRPS